MSVCVLKFAFVKEHKNDVELKFLENKVSWRFGASPSRVDLCAELERVPFHWKVALQCYWDFCAANSVTCCPQFATRRKKEILIKVKVLTWTKRAVMCFLVSHPPFSPPSLVLDPRKNVNFFANANICEQWIELNTSVFTLEELISFGGRFHLLFFLPFVRRNNWHAERWRLLLHNSPDSKLGCAPQACFLDEVRHSHSGHERKLLFLRKSVLSQRYVK